MTREVPLTRGFVAIVDDEDFARVSAKKWTACNVDGDTCRAQHYWREGSRVRAIGIARFILDAPPKMHVDHINGDTLDNRRANLRICRPEENAKNRAKSRASTSPYKGVKFLRNRWEAYVGQNGAAVYVGRYETAEEAARAYDAKALEVHGEFARLNFPHGEWAKADELKGRGDA